MSAGEEKSDLQGIKDVVVVVGISIEVNGLPSTLLGVRTNVISIHLHCPTPFLTPGLNPPG